jgi:hypothetical protein
MTQPSAGATLNLLTLIIISLRVDLTNIEEGWVGLVWRENFEILMMNKLIWGCCQILLQTQAKK